MVGGCFMSLDRKINRIQFLSGNSLKVIAVLTMLIDHLCKIVLQWLLSNYWAAGMTTNMIANMSKEGKHISMDTLARICETLNCKITDVIELVPDEPASTGGKEHERIETKNNRKRN